MNNKDGDYDTHNTCYGEVLLTDLRNWLIIIY